MIPNDWIVRINITTQWKHIKITREMLTEISSNNRGYILSQYFGRFFKEQTQRCLKWPYKRDNETVVNEGWTVITWNIYWWCGDEE